MLLDPFTIIAQIVNFAVLAFALKHFLYNRVIEAMDTREASIAARLNDAEEREAAAADEADGYRRRRKELDDQRHDLLDKARADAGRHHKELLDEARSDVDEERCRWLRALRAEKREFHGELQRQTAQEVVDLTRRALSDLAQANLESITIRSGLDRLASDERAQADLLGDDETRASMTVRTAFRVSDEQRRQIIDRLRSIGFGSDQKVRFEEDPDLIMGIEFQGDGTAVSWHAADYLDRLGANFVALIDNTEGARDEA